MSKILKIYENNPNPKVVEQAVEILRNGGLIIYPTDTVYGLGCDITKIKALEKVAKIKQVKLEKANFSFICYDLSNLSAYVRQIETPTYKILKRALPGPYTFILKGNNNLPKAFKKKKTVGSGSLTTILSEQLLKNWGIRSFRPRFVMRMMSLNIPLIPN